MKFFTLYLVSMDGLKLTSTSLNFWQSCSSWYIWYGLGMVWAWYGISMIHAWYDIVMVLELYERKESSGSPPPGKGNAWEGGYTCGKYRLPVTNVNSSVIFLTVYYVRQCLYWSFYWNFLLMLTFCCHTNELLLEY